MKLYSCLLFQLLFICSTQAQKISHTEKRNSQLTHVKGNDFEGVIFSKDFAFPFHKNESGDKRFTPTNEEIENAESILSKDISTINALQPNQGGDKGPVIHKNLKNYIRQYYGYFNHCGDKIIFISCLLKGNYKVAPSVTPNWLKGAVLVLNGGSNYWQVQANISRSKLFELDVNGIDRSSSLR